jgi:uncharacterized protein (TIGR02118 family)
MKESAMAQLIVIYENPHDPGAFEDHYSRRHLPLAAEKMPGVRGARTFRVLGAVDGDTTPYYRVAVMDYDSVADLNAAVASDGGREVLADLSNFATGGATALLCDDDEPTEA